MTSGRRKLKNLLVFPESQTRYGILFLSLAAFTHVALTLIVLRLYATWSAEEELGIPLWIAIGGLALIYLLIQTFAFFLGMLMSHKIFGPLVAIRNFVGLLKQGQYGERLHLRTNDDLVLREIGDDLNAIAEILAKR